MPEEWSVSEMPIEHATLGFLRQIEVEFDGFGWDKLPVLGIVERQHSEVSSDAVAMAFILRFWPMHVYTREEVDRPLEEVLKKFTQIVSEQSQEDRPPDSLQAVVLVHETWQLDPADGLSADEVEEAMRRQEVHLHPKRRSVRWLTAVDRAGQRYTVTRRQHEQPMSFFGTTQSNGVAGDALAVLMTASL